MKIKKVNQFITENLKIKIGEYEISSMSNIIEIYNEQVAISLDKKYVPDLIKFLENVLLEYDSNKYNL